MFFDAGILYAFWKLSERSRAGRRDAVFLLLLSAAVFVAAVCLLSGARRVGEARVRGFGVWAAITLSLLGLFYFMKNEAEPLVVQLV